ncbi:hypothetical protein BT93_K1949 [Corymbia citriodora subsp. variegata]|nr:hypothetical protein BT93_K1949 [Corymbia citriodora subsp. variegata]
MLHPEQVPLAENSHMTSNTPLESCCSCNRIPCRHHRPPSCHRLQRSALTRARGGPGAGAWSKSEHDGDDPVAGGHLPTTWSSSRASAQPTLGLGTGGHQRCRRSFWPEKGKSESREMRTSWSNIWLLRFVVI